MIHCIRVVGKGCVERFKRQIRGGGGALAAFHLSHALLRVKNLEAASLSQGDFASNIGKAGLEEPWS
jgi:hypothetical protein